MFDYGGVMFCVLIVDDLLIEIYKFKEILEKYGFEIIIVDNGVDGVVVVC